MGPRNCNERYRATRTLVCLPRFSSTAEPSATTIEGLRLLEGLRGLSPPGQYRTTVPCSPVTFVFGLLNSAVSGARSQSTLDLCRILYPTAAGTSIRRSRNDSSRRRFRSPSSSRLLSGNSLRRNDPRSSAALMRSIRISSAGVLLWRSRRSPNGQSAFCSMASERVSAFSPTPPKIKTAAHPALCSEHSRARTPPPVAIVCLLLAACRAAGTHDDKGRIAQKLNPDFRESARSVQSSSDAHSRSIRSSGCRGLPTNSNPYS